MCNAQLFVTPVDIRPFFRSTPKSRPNNIGQMSVRPQKVFPIPMKFGMSMSDARRYAV